MDCRPGCGACCSVISISSPIPGMPNGKPAGVKCIHLNESLLCAIYGHPDKPKVCSDFKYDSDICGNSREEAIKILTQLEENFKNIITQ